MATTKAQAIRTGDKFESPKIGQWEVLRALPGGKMDMKRCDRARFGMFTVSEVREWKRLTAYVK